ncbi:MAG: tRNA-specific adenosine deaminase, partial [Planctomycetota bacterium]
TACHWARISTIVYGASISDAKNAGFSELSISNEKMKQLGPTPVEIISGFMRKQNVELFNLWLQKPDKKVY